jgi:hypothetical protein
MLRPRLLVVLVLAAAALPVPLARAASTYSQVLKTYQVHGSIPACAFSSPQLERALRAIDTYGAQYFQDFSTAIQNALSARASGGCAPAGVRSRGSAAAAPLPPLALGPVTGATHSSLPAPVLLLAGLAAVLALIAGAALLARWRGWSPAWAARFSHAWGEVGYRSEGRWLELSDWLRSGAR